MAYIGGILATMTVAGFMAIVPVIIVPIVIVPVIIYFTDGYLAYWASHQWQQ